MKLSRGYSHEAPPAAESILDRAAWCGSHRRRGGRHNHARICRQLSLGTGARPRNRDLADIRWAPVLDIRIRPCHRGYVLDSECLRQRHHLPSLWNVEPEAGEHLRDVRPSPAREQPNIGSVEPLGPDAAALIRRRASPTGTTTGDRKAAWLTVQTPYVTLGGMNRRQRRGHGPPTLPTSYPGEEPW